MVDALQGFMQYLLKFKHRYNIIGENSLIGKYLP